MGAQGPEDFTARRYEVRHRATYTYDGDDVVYCVERGFLAPRNTPTQTVESNHIEVSPDPDLLSEHTDYFGNRSHYVEVRERHRVLDVFKKSVVKVRWPEADIGMLDQWTLHTAAEEIRRTQDPLLVADFALPSELVPIEPAVVAYAEEILSAEMPFGSAVVSLCERVYHDFKYQPGSTTVRTTLAELMDQRSGVCQDFTHVALGVLRHFGLPARYVSGYLETQPPPGKEKLEGSDASHAWASVMTPTGDWIDLDPTNCHLADSRYVVTAWGRDFGDVSPLKGVIFSEAEKSSLDVGVDVIRLEG